MGATYEILIDMPCPVPEEEARAILGRMLEAVPSPRADRIRFCSLTDDLRITPACVASGDFEVDDQGLGFVDGRIRMHRDFIRVHAEVGGRWRDGVEIDIDPRKRLDVIFEALDRVCSAAPGDVVGYFWHEHGNDAGPMIATPAGLRFAYSHGDRDEIEHSKRSGEPVPPAITSLPVGLVDHDDTSRVCEIDTSILRRMTGDDPVDRLRAHAEAEDLSR
jgi:hypothetical protein